jgi:pimeloyl-ACP methyl ester carboxylesterase
MADDVAGVLNAYAVERPHFVGQSMGGNILQEFGLRHPDRANTLTIIMSSPDPPRVERLVSVIVT